MGDWHFQYSIDADEENHVMYAKVFGVWREDTALSYHEDFVREAEVVIKNKWAKLVDLSNWRAGTDDVIVRIGEHMEWCLEHNMVCQVYVIQDTVRFNQLQKMFAKGGAKAASATFRTRGEAEKFLTKQGFKIK